MSRISIPDVGTFERETLPSMPSASEHVRYSWVQDSTDAFQPSGVSQKSMIAFVGGVLGGLTGGILLTLCLI